MSRPELHSKLPNQQSHVGCRFTTTDLISIHNLFYTGALTRDALELRAILDSGTMACSLSSHMLSRLEKTFILIG